MDRMIDVTDLNLSDAVMEVVAKVKAGEFSVDVQHLTPNERYSVGKLLGWKTIPDHWMFDPAPKRESDDGIDYERLILEDQDEHYDG